MRDLLKFIGKVILGTALITAILLLFNPIGSLVCGPSECMENDLQGNWVLFGVVGAFSTAFTFISLGLLYVVGDWTTDRAVDVKYEIDTWYTKKQLARIPPEALEDNGEPGNDYDIP